MIFLVMQRLADFAREMGRTELAETKLSRAARRGLTLEVMLPLLWHELASSSDDPHEGP